MYLVILITLIAIFLTFLDSRGKMKNGMSWGFVLVTLLGCIHYDYGNDYMGYQTMFKEITMLPLSIDSLVNDEYGHEPGWVILNHLFSHLGGFYVMVAVLNVIQNAIYYRFIKDNVHKNNWTIAVMIYLMSTSLYILNFSMMRQGLAISLFVLAWSFIKKKRLIPTLLIIGIASSIHYSAQVLFPFALLPFIPLNKKVISVIYVVLIVALYLSSNLLSDTVEAIAAIEDLKSAQSLEYYQSNNSTTVTYGLGFVINLLPFVIAIWGLFKRGQLINDEKKMLMMLSMVSFLVAPFAQVLQLLGRFIMYFSAIDVAAIPFIYSLLPNKKVHQFLMAIYIFMLAYSYIMFFLSDVYSKQYSTFHTIFEVL